MSWFKENRHNVYGVLVFIVCYILLVMIALRPSYAFDSYWHLQMGKDLFENGLSPWIDHYSFTHNGEAIAEVPVIFQLLIYLFVSFSNESTGFFYVKLFYLTLILLFLYIYFRKIKASWIIALLVLPVIAYFIYLRLIIRPEIFSNVLIVVSLILYLKAKERFGTYEVASICILMLFWVNYHTPIFGYIIFFGLFLDKAIQKIKGDETFSWGHWFLWGALVFIAGFIKPHGQHLIIAMLSFHSSDIGQYIQEYIPSYSFYERNHMVMLTWVLSIYVAVWSLVKKEYGFAFIALILTYFSIKMSRLVTPASIINLCILALYLSQVSYARLVAVLKPSIRYAIIGVSSLLPLFSLYYLTEQVYYSLDEYEREAELIDKRFPVQVADFLKDFNTEGNILNFMDLGGYLIYKLSPDYKVYIDGRTGILYPIDFVEHNQKIVNDSVALQKEIKNNDIQYAIYKNRADRLLRFKGVSKLDLAFADENFVLYSHNKDVAFPLASKLMVYPMCWRDEFASDFRREVSLSRTLLKNKSYTIRSVISFMENYLSSGDKKLFIENLDVNRLSLDSNRRIAAYLALNHQLYDVAETLFASISKKTDYDILMRSFSLVKTGHYLSAEVLLYYLYTNAVVSNDGNISVNALLIFSRLLDVIQNNHKLVKFSSEYVNEIRNNVIKNNYNNGESSGSVKPFYSSCELLFN